MAASPRKDLKLFDLSYSYGQLAALTGFALRRASLLDFGNFGDSVGDRAITPLRYSLLEIVGSNPGLQQVELAKILGLSKPAATLGLDFWQKRDCISRRKERDDRRSYGIHLTETGAAILEQLRESVRKHDEALTACLSDEELLQLRTLLRRIYSG